MAASENEDRKTDDQETEVSLDMSQAQIKRMIAEARERGYITYDQLNTVLPPDQVSSEQIEDVMSMLSEMGINIIEDDEVEDEDRGPTDLVATGTKDVAVSTGETEKLDRTDDPVRMYLREMGSVELLSREGEIAIAKRIEAGRNTMILGLCESPLTFQAITIFGAGDPKAMAGGISGALITTVLGLLVAIPTVLLHTIVNGRSQRIIHVLNEQATGIVAEHSERDHKK